MRTIRTALPAKADFHQFIKYACTGALAALVEWSTFWLCIAQAKVFYIFAVAIAFVLATLVNYILSARFVFSNGRRTPTAEFFLVYAVSAVGLGLNFLLMWLLHGRLGVNAMPAKFFSTGIVFFWNYLSRRCFVFRPSSPSSEEGEDGAAGELR